MNQSTYYYKFKDAADAQKAHQEIASRGLMAIATLEGTDLTLSGPDLSVGDAAKIAEKHGGKLGPSLSF